MRINNTARTRASGKTKASSKSGNRGFVPQSPASAQSASTAATARTGPIVSIESLIALQESEDFRKARKMATERADTLLDLLSDVRLGLLEGALPRQALQRLSHTLQQQRANTGDARLEAILNEVEIRAEVEKAKLDLLR
jgi:Class II flagellar assembly regulator